MRFSERKEEFLRNLKKEMIRSAVSGNWKSLWYVELKKAYLEAGGNSYEIEALEKSLEENLPRMEVFIRVSLREKGGFLYSEKEFENIASSLRCSGFSEGEAIFLAGRVFDPIYHSAK